MATNVLGSLSLDIRDATRRFGDKVVLDGVDLAVGRGEFVALLGPSGSGKSTLLRGIAGLDDEVEGEFTVPERRTVVFQDPRLLPWKRVVDNVRLGLPRSERERATAALADVGLSGHVSAWPITLSGGEAQRVALARALVRRPKAMLRDEPVGEVRGQKQNRKKGKGEQKRGRADQANPDRQDAGEEHGGQHLAKGNLMTTAAGQPRGMSSGCPLQHQPVSHKGADEGANDGG